MLRKSVLPSVLIIFLTFLVYSNALNNGFVTDDIVHIEQNGFITDWRYFPHLFKIKQYFTAFGERCYWPVVSLSYFIDYSFWKLNPSGYHLTNVVFHSLTGVLVYFATNLMVEDKVVAFLTALLFAVHPVHNETVSFVSGRTDLLSTFFLFLSLVAHLASRKRLKLEGKLRQPILRALSLSSFLFALFAKEMAVTLPLVILLYEVCFVSSNERMRDKARKVVPYFLLGGFYLGARLLLFKSQGVVGGVDLSQSLVHPGAAHIFRTMLVMSRTYVFYLKLLFFPFKLSVNHLFPLLKSVLEWQIILSTLLVGAIVFLAGRKLRTNPAITFSSFFFLTTLLPVSNLIPLGTIAQERYLYLPSFGFCLFLAQSLRTIASQIGCKREGFGGQKLLSSLASLGILFFILVFYSLRTIRRNFDWKDNLTLFTQELKSYPQAGFNYYVLGDFYYNRGDREKAFEHYRQALLLGGPLVNAAGLHYRLGKILLERGDYGSAEIQLQMALAFSPKYPEARNCLGVVYFEEGENEKAIQEFEKAIVINPSLIDAYSNLVKVYLSLGKHEEAVKVVGRMKAINHPRNPLKK